MGTANELDYLVGQVSLAGQVSDVRSTSMDACRSNSRSPSSAFAAASTVDASPARDVLEQVLFRLDLPATRIDARTLASPAIPGGRIFIRTEL